MSELYHALNRGVDKRNIFLEDGDRVRFVHNLYEFNTTKPANNTAWLLSRQNNDLRSRYFEKLVDIHGWCLMTNHYHLLISERIENGMSLFLRKINVGYANFFNTKHDRSGTLFQGRTKKILIDSDAYFLHILHYIHLNPLDFLSSASDWRKKKLGNANTALEHLHNYRWSSYLDYCGKANFPSLINTDLYADVYGNYKKEISSYLQDLELSSIRHYTLE